MKLGFGRRARLMTFGITMTMALGFAFQNCSGSKSGGGALNGASTDATRIRGTSISGSNWTLELNPANGAFPTLRSPARVIDTQNGLGYSYGASIVLSDDGTGLAYHSYSCGADYSGDGWDRIFYTRSTDRVNWSAVTIPLRATRGSAELSACDPSVIRYNAGDGLYYYMYYGGGNGHMYVARSRLAAGPFLKFTERGTWEENAADPKIVMRHSPRITTNMSADGTTQIWYGSGEPTVVVVGNQIYAWYTDDTTQAPAKSGSLVLMRRASSPTQFGDAVITNIPAADGTSVDVKFDEARGRFILIGLRDQISTRSRLSIAASVDGVTWTDPKEFCPAGTCLPPYASNVGASGDEQGHLIGSETFLTYGAPWNLSGAGCATDLCWARWSLYGGAVTIDGGSGTADVRVSTSTNARPVSAAGGSPSAPPPATTKYRMTSVNANEELWPARNAIDGTPNGVYSSQPFATSANDRAVQLAAWMDGPKDVSKLQLTARLNAQGQPLAFATQYSVYLTNAGNTAWDYIGEFPATPGVNGVATIAFPLRTTWGALIIPRVLAKDPQVYYFQLDEINLAP